MWRNLDSLLLTDSGWQAAPYQLNEDEQAFLGSAQLRSVRDCENTSNYGAKIEVATSDRFGYVAITRHRGEGLGCRVLAKALCLLARESGGIEKMPTHLFFRTHTDPPAIRGLLTLQYLSGSSTRHLIRQGYKWEHVPTLEKEKARLRQGSSEISYEKRAVGEILKHFPGFRLEKASSLRLLDVKSDPDGLFVDEEHQKVIIVEAKKRERTFSEGTAQIVQYYAQAKTHARYRGMQIATYLVTADAETTGGYDFWEDLVASSKSLGFIVDF